MGAGVFVVQYCWNICLPELKTRGVPSLHLLPADRTVAPPVGGVEQEASWQGSLEIQFTGPQTSEPSAKGRAARQKASDRCTTQGDLPVQWHLQGHHLSLSCPRGCHLLGWWVCQKTPDAPGGGHTVPCIPGPCGEWRLS